jgi:PhnB protein
MKKGARGGRAARQKRRGAKRRETAPAVDRAAAIPTGYHTVTPHLTVRGAADAIDFYKRAFGARERGRMPLPDGKTIMHAELQIGDSIVFLADEFPDMGCRAPQTLGGATGALHLYVRDVDHAFRRAVAAGAEVRMPVADMFWGDRYAKVADPFGHEWGLATHKADLSAREIGRRAEAFFSRMGERP